MSRFEPVHLPDDRRLDGRASQTFLRHYAQCPRSGFLYAAYKGEASTREMQRGKAAHVVWERAIRAAVENDEPVIPGEILKVIVNEVLAEIPVPFEEHDYIREMVWRWSAETAIDPRAVIACETLFVLEVGGYQVRAKVDLAELLENGAAVHVVDWKTARSAPPFEEIARKRPDGTLLAKNFQLVLYALVVAFGVPVRVEPCQACAENPSLIVPPGEAVEITGEPGQILVAGDPPRWSCAACDSRGYVEIPEPFPLASRAQRFELEYVYPGIEDRDGKMLRRPVTLTRAELDEYRLSLEGLLRRLAHSEETGDWPAVASDAACAECPAKRLCPIPVELNDHRGEINTVEECAEAFEKAEVEKKLAGGMQRERRAFVKAHGPVRFGGGMVAEIGHTSSERIEDKEGFLAAVERAVRYGEPLERHRFVKSVDSFPLVVRALTADELAESEGSNDGRDGDGGGDDADERWGAEAPF